MSSFLGMEDIQDPIERLRASDLRRSNGGFSRLKKFTPLYKGLCHTFLSNGIMLTW